MQIENLFMTHGNISEPLPKWKKSRIFHPLHKSFETALRYNASHSRESISHQVGQR